jgi:hypothetical protein
MKNTLNYMLMMILLPACVLLSCNQEADYKTVREEVVKQHDKLMADDETLMQHKMQLDTLVQSLAEIKAQQPDLDTAKVRNEIAAINTKFTAAEDAMSNWMQQFKTDVDGKSNAEAVAYFEAEKKKVTALDSVYRDLLKQSGAYLERFNIKHDTAGHSHQH